MNEETISDSADADLLARFTNTGSELAFGELVRRYAGLIHATALRLTRDPDMAAAVAQSVFILLARKSASLGDDRSLAGWLYRTTVHVAQQARRAEWRRLRRETEAHRMQPTPDSEPTWQQLAVDLDDALQNLNDTDRHAVLLYFGQGKTHREVGALLGLGEEAAKKRTHRALDRLRQFFRGKGLVVGASTLASGLTGYLAMPPASALIDSWKQLGTSSTAVGNGSLEYLVPPNNQTAFWRRWPRVAIAAGVLALVTTGALGWISARKRRTDPETAIVPGSSSASARVESTISGANAIRGDSTSFALHVTSTNQEPIPQAKVWLQTVRHGDWKQLSGFATDDTGRCELNLPDELGRFDVSAWAPGFGARTFKWVRHHHGFQPASYQLQLSPAAMIGGTVIDPEGQPISEVHVALETGFHGDSSGREPEQEIEGGFMPLEIAVTDAAGRWQSSAWPRESSGGQLTFSHPRYARRVAGTNRDLLLTQKHQVVLDLAQWLTGILVGPESEIVAGATVTLNGSWNTLQPPSVSTDASGMFQLRCVPLNGFKLGILAEGYEPKSEVIAPGVQPNPLRIQLKRGLELAIKVSNEADQPIAGAYVVLERGFDGKSSSTDAAGIAKFAGVPEAVVKDPRVYVAADGYQSVRNHEPRRVDAGFEIALAETPVVSGTIFDGDSGIAIPQFKFFPARGEGPTDADRSERRIGSNGAFSLALSDPDFSTAIRFEAEGYEPQTVTLSPDPKTRALIEVHLRRPDQRPANAIRGEVLNRDGYPARVAKVMLFDVETDFALVHGELVSRCAAPAIPPDSSGRFEFKPTTTTYAVIAASTDGFARALAKPGDNLTLRLEPYGSLKVFARRGGSPLINHQIHLNPVHGGPRALWWGLVGHSSNTTFTEPDPGTFFMEQIPPGRYYLSLYGPANAGFLGQTGVTISPGETTSISICERSPNHPTVRGQLKASMPGVVSNWVEQLPDLVLEQRTITAQYRMNLPPTEQYLEEARWSLSAEAQTEPFRERFPVVPGNDGSFEVPGVPPGDYYLFGLSSPDNRRSRRRATGSDSAILDESWWTHVYQKVVVPELEAAKDGLYSVGEIPVEIHLK